MNDLVEITGIASGGAGVGRLADGRAVFVHRTALGDRATVRLTDEKRTWVRGTLVTIDRAGPGRRPAPCRYYARCGGCTLEHLEYDTQLQAKTRIVHDALTRIGKLSVAVPEIVPSPREFQYRNRVSFTLLRLAHAVVAGFHELEQPGRVLDIGAACLLPEPPIAKAWEQLRENWGVQAERLPPGPKLRLTLRATADGSISLIIEGGHGEGRADELLARVPALRSIWHRPRPDAEMSRIAGEATLSESWQDEDLDLSGSVFLQVNRAAAQLLEDYVIASAGAVAGERVIDAYCGVGVHARRLARLGADVTGIELDPLAVAEARAAPGDAVRFVCGRTEELLPVYLPADLVIINPPRAGIHEAAARALREAPAARLIYISCNPATLARDLDRLRDRYRVMALRCFDLFPQTAHVESVVELACVTT